MNMLGVKDFLDAQQEAAALAAKENISFSQALKRTTKSKEQELREREREAEILLENMRTTSNNFINIFK